MCLCTYTPNKQTVVVETKALSWSIHFINKHKLEMFIVKHINIEQFYSLEAISVLFVLLASSQPHLIFIIFLLKQGKESTTLHIRTTVGRTTAIIKVGGVYHTNWLISTHLFQAKIKACTVPRRRETIPSLLCKRKYIMTLSKGWFSISRFQPACLGLVLLLGNPFIWKFFHLLQLFSQHGPSTPFYSFHSLSSSHDFWVTVLVSKVSWKVITFFLGSGQQLYLCLLCHSA